MIQLGMLGGAVEVIFTTTLWFSPDDTQGLTTAKLREKIRDWAIRCLESDLTTLSTDASKPCPLCHYAPEKELIT